MGTPDEDSPAWAGVFTVSHDLGAESLTRPALGLLAHKAGARGSFDGLEALVFGEPLLCRWALASCLVEAGGKLAQPNVWLPGPPWPAPSPIRDPRHEFSLASPC